MTSAVGRDHDPRSAQPLTETQPQERAEPTAPAPRRRRPLARTFSRARWAEYRALLESALAHGYTLLSLEEWLLGGARRPPRTIILRHDVDQHPRSVLPILAIERDLGVRATWYFRWRTAHPAIISAVREAGADIGLHYETLTRLVLERRLSADDVDDSLIAQARTILAREIAAFNHRFGPIRSVCPHGDTRVPGVTNQILLRDEEPERYGILLDGNADIDRRPLELWLTDRSVSDGRWKDGIDPAAVLERGVEPVLLLVHPNNWCSGPSLWLDRIESKLLPRPRPGTTRGWRSTARTGTDTVPLLPAPTRSGGRTRHPVDFTPIATSLRREVLRFYYESGKSMSDAAGRNTLATNSDLAESRAATLERALAAAGVTDLRGLRLLDLGCGFGALALVFAARGARVLGLDPNGERLEIGRRVAHAHNLDARFDVAAMQDPGLQGQDFDVAVMNNSLCYVTTRRERLVALEQTLRSLRPGGVLVVRNPNRLHPRDQFTGVPGLNALPPRIADAVAGLLRRHRSHVRLLTPAAARRELLAAGFIDVHSVRRPRETRLRALFAGYQHLTGRRP